MKASPKRWVSRPAWLVRHTARAYAWRRAAAQQHDRREAGPRGQLTRPAETAAAGPLVGEQHRIEPLRQEFRGQRAGTQRAVHHQLRLGTPGAEAVTDAGAVLRVFLDQE